MSNKRYVDIEKDNMISTLDMYIGNILTITNGKGKLSDMKHIVIRHQPNSRVKPKFINVASGKEVIVGEEISLKGNYEIFTNSKCLAEVEGEDLRMSTEVLDILYKINGKEKVMEYIRKSQSR